jgi:hypothetical protein
MPEIWIWLMAGFGDTLTLDRFSSEGTDTVPSTSTVPEEFTFTGYGHTG